MMRKLTYLLIISVTITGICYLFSGEKHGLKKKDLEKQLTLLSNKKKPTKQEADYKRWRHEWKQLHDPATGQIPKDIHRKEMALLASIIQKQKAAGFRLQINNSYTAAGPTQNGGRTRALAFDMRNNQVVLAAGVSGGIFRSTNGGSSWGFVHPSNDVRNVSCIAQDPRPGFQDIWYAGTGELLGSSPQYPNAFIPGHGIYKSTNNGVTWSKLSFTANNTASSFDDIFDIVFNIKVDANGVVYAAILNFIIRSADGGATWGIAIHETSELATSNQNIYNMITDIDVSKPGVNPVRYYASFSGRNRNRDTAGIWTSTSGSFGTWTRIAGGRFGNADSVAGWRPYNNSTVLSGNYTNGWGKTSLAIAPGNSNILYVMYQNAQSAASNQPEADLFKADLSTNPITWSNNRSVNLRATRTTLPPSSTSSTKYMELQDGYNMLLAVHPTNPDLVVAGGVNLFRSTDGFATQGTFIGGLTSTTFTDPSQFSHVDFHSFSFDPSNANRFAVCNDGGLQVTNDIAASSVSWNNFASQYQTLQYYHVAIDPLAGSLVFAGGSQDNSTTYRDAKGLLDVPLADPNDHYVGLVGGDGGMTALSASTTTQQYFYGSAQNGIVARYNINALSTTANLITPTDAGEGEFVTYFHLDADNTDNLYFVSNDSIWRTTNATTVTENTGWTNMSGISTLLTGNIFSLATTRGAYAGNSSYMYIGTENGKIYRLQNPRDAAAVTTPIDISPLTGLTSQSLVREIAVNPRNADTVLAVVSNYGVASAFWSGNATSASPTWQLVEGNVALASFRSCAIVATNSGVEYYIGTSIGLFSTLAINGNSTNWTLEGPPVLQGAIVNDLALRITDNTLLIGTHGNGMYYTNIGNIPTPVVDLIRNNKQFISLVFPTVSNQQIQFQTGGATGIKSINIRVYTMNGQVVMQQTQGYQNGTVNIVHLPAGSYVLEIMSANRKYHHVQQIVKTQ